MMFQVGKEQLVRTVYTLSHILNCLRTEFVPIQEPFCMFELCEMFLERIDIKGFPEHTVVSAVQGDTVVDGTPKRPTRTENSSVRSSAYVDVASDIYLLMQFLVSPCLV